MLGGRCHAGMKISCWEGRCHAGREMSYRKGKCHDEGTGVVLGGRCHASMEISCWEGRCHVGREMSYRKGKCHDEELVSCWYENVMLEGRFHAGREGGHAGRGDVMKVLCWEGGVMFEGRCYVGKGNMCPTEFETNHFAQNERFITIELNRATIVIKRSYWSGCGKGGLRCVSIDLLPDINEKGTISKIWVKLNKTIHYTRIKPSVPLTTD